MQPRSPPARSALSGTIRPAAAAPAIPAGPRLPACLSCNKGISSSTHTLANCGVSGRSAGPESTHHSAGLAVHCTRLVSRQGALEGHSFSPSQMLLRRHRTLSSEPAPAPCEAPCAAWLAWTPLHSHRPPQRAGWSNVCFLLAASGYSSLAGCVQHTPGALAQLQLLESRSGTVGPTSSEHYSVSSSDGLIPHLRRLLRDLPPKASPPVMAASFFSSAAASAAAAAAATCKQPRCSELHSCLQSADSAGLLANAA